MRVTPLLFELTLIDLAVVGGLAFVVPVALGGGWGRWLAVAASAAAALRCERASAAAVVLALPWVLVAAVTVIQQLRSARSVRHWRLPDLVALAMGGYLLGAAVWFVLSRAGANPTGLTEPIVELTAVHFTYVGVGALHLARVEASAATNPRARRVSTAAVVLTAGAPPIIALGFAADLPVPKVAGAVLLTIGVWCTAALELRRAARQGDPVASRLLLGLSGLAVWAPMVLAVTWAAGQEWDVPALSIPDMARTHGAVNAVGFIGLGLAAALADPKRKQRGPWGDRPEPSDVGLVGLRRGE